MKYIGYSKETHIDGGLQFESDKWCPLLHSGVIKRFGRGIESRNSVWIGEKYHDILRRIHRKVRMEYLNISKVEYSAISTRGNPPTLREDWK